MANIGNVTPVTILTGYLGAGKTTLLNHLLTAQHGQKYALIINEFGELGIDDQLVVAADEEIFEMNNGCVCCTVRGDLIRIITGLLKRSQKFDGIIVETTGLAAPAPVAQSFFADADLQQKTRLDAIITVVDAKNIQRQLAETSEAAAQIAFADVILLNKTDLVSAEELDAAEQKIRSINRFCELIRTTEGVINPAQVLGRQAFELEKILAVEPGFLTNGHHHDHNTEVTSLSLSTDEAIDPELFEEWMAVLLREKGADIFRSKGVLVIEGENKRLVFQAVHMQFRIAFGQNWRPREKRQSQLVFIGRNLDFASLKRGFLNCVA
ncbi:MAG: GTP-binding protein [Alphaproteobacteria bacterium]|nr:GTP-binding protein [Alphaproteobacteria bacterium]